MPPKAKFTKAEIVEAALRIVRTDGIEALTARALGAALGSSARPIFTVFQNMDEVRQAAVAAAKQCYKAYVMTGLRQAEMPAFKGVGMQYVRFSLEEPKLFQLLFMNEQPTQNTIGHILPAIEENFAQILSSIQTGYGLKRADSEWLYRHLWVYTHGIAVLCATNLCRFSDEEMSRMMTDVFTALLKECKSREPGGKKT